MERPYYQNPDLDGSSFFWPGGDSGVLLFHGFTATTVEVRPMAHVLNEHGYTVAGPLLPGHGTTIEDLNRQKWQDWVEATEKAYQEINNRCKQVYLAGSSMGGLLCLYLAANHPEVGGVMLYAPAIRVKGLRFSLYASLFLQTRQKTYLTQGGMAPPEDILPWQGYNLIAVRAAAQFYRFQQKVIHLLPKIEQPTLIFQGRMDHTVDPLGAEFAYDQIGSQRKMLVWLDRSPHTILLNVDFEQAAQQSLNFLESIEDKEFEKAE